MEIRIPDIGDFDKVPVIEILVSSGDRVQAEDPLVVLESDKATMEVPAPTSGTIQSIAIKVGDTVGQGDLLGVMEVEKDGATDNPPSREEAETTAALNAGPEKSVASPAPAPAAAAAESRIVEVPDIGDFQGIPVIEILVRPGDSVAPEDPLVVLESDKATMEVPAPCAGTVQEVLTTVGAKVSQGTPVVSLMAEPASKSTPAEDAATAESDTGPAAAAQQPPPAPTEKRTTTSTKATSSAPPLNREVTPADIPHASPSIRRFAREIGVNLAQVTGSGRKGRITREDVQDYAKLRLQGEQPAAAGAGIPEIPAVDFSRFGPVVETPLARIRQISARHLHRCWLNVPHVTQCDSADITELEAFRKRQNQRGEGPKLTVLPFIMKACALLLKRFPDFNSAMNAAGDALIRREYVHIGFAADTPNGLVVPVVRDADSKTLGELATECASLAAKAREGKLSPGDMQGGCFSISSLGGIGGEYFTPIVNSPEVAILGVSRAAMRPEWNGEEFEARLMVPLSLSYDHRVIDGAAAARFTTELRNLLGDIRRMML